ncbi:MAG TPA: DUF4476 domain-containing protein [Flavitalea sp.]|nr:DUF4476 domain-containing protein [Flavitalea sp.]
MKKLSFIAIAFLLHAAGVAQSVVLRFEGANTNSNGAARNYAVDIDGKRFYSYNAEVAGTSGGRQLLVDNLNTGSHRIAVYRVDNNSTASTGNNNTALYSNSFQIRNGYDMVIAVRRNGQVSFTEKSNTGAASTTSKPAMTTTQFDKLLQATKTKWSQTSRYTDIKKSLANKAYYFTTDQVGELLQLVTSETKRLELAKLSYPKITDPSNFGDMTDLFSSQANKTNLEKFILTKNPSANIGTSSDTYNSRPPVSTQQFNQLLRTVRNQYQQSGKYAVLRDALSQSEYYYTTAQFRQLLPQITTETERLELAKLGYARASDQSAYNTLTDLFSQQASRDDLNNFIRYGQTNTNTTTPNTNTGQYSNRVAMTDGEFSKLQLKARLHIRQSSMVTDLKEALSNKNNYFTNEQIRSLIAMVGTESDRVMLAKLAFHRSTDPTTFTQLWDLFPTQASIDDLNNYIKTNPS